MGIRLKSIIGVFEQGEFDQQEKYCRGVALVSRALYLFHSLDFSSVPTSAFLAHPKLSRNLHVHFPITHHLVRAHLHAIRILIRNILASLSRCLSPSSMFRYVQKQHTALHLQHNTSFIHTSQEHLYLDSKHQFGLTIICCQTLLVISRLMARDL